LQVEISCHNVFIHSKYSTACSILTAPNVSDDIINCELNFSAGDHSNGGFSNWPPRAQQFESPDVEADRFLENPERARAVLR
jgi:hypothetical protein